MYPSLHSYTHCPSKASYLNCLQILNKLYPSLTPFSPTSNPRGEVYADVRYHFSELKKKSGIFLSFVLPFAIIRLSVDSSFFNNTLQRMRLLILCTLLSRALLTSDLLAFFVNHLHCQPPKRRTHHKAKKL